VAYTTRHTHSFFWRPKEQQSEKMHLEKDKEYYYQAYFADGQGEYMFELGLFAGRTNFTQEYLPDLVRDEQQQIVLKSNSQPNIQVYLFY